MIFTASSLLHLTVASLDQCLSIRYPMSYLKRATTLNITIIILATWIISGIICSPAIVLVIMETSFTGSSFGACRPRSVDYCLLESFLTFALPMILGMISFLLFCVSAFKKHKVVTQEALQNLATRADKYLIPLEETNGGSLSKDAQNGKVVSKGNVKKQSPIKESLQQRSPKKENGNFINLKVLKTQLDKGDAQLLSKSSDQLSENRGHDNLAFAMDAVESDIITSTTQESFKPETDKRELPLTAEESSHSKKENIIQNNSCVIEEYSIPGISCDNDNNLNSNDKNNFTSTSQESKETLTSLGILSETHPFPRQNGVVTHHVTNGKWQWNGLRTSTAAHLRLTQKKTEEQTAQNVLGLMLFFFLVTNLPYYLTYLISVCGHIRVREPDVNIILWISYSTSLLHPVLIFIANAEFRRTVFEAIFCPCVNSSCRYEVEGAITEPGAGSKYNL